jgi:hypothetical protein
MALSMDGAMAAVTHTDLSADLPAVVEKHLRLPDFSVLRARSSSPT